MSHPSNTSAPHGRQRVVWVIALASLGVAATAGAAWEGGLKDQLLPKNWGRVEPGLYRSGQLSSAVCRGTLARHGIDVIVNLGEDKVGKRDQDAERDAARDLGIDRRTLFLKGDGTGPVDSYVEAVAAIAAARERGDDVLVHCSAGSQRTGGVVAAYQLLVRRRPVNEVMAELRSHGWSPSDNPALLPYLNENLPKIAADLTRRGVIDAAPAATPVLYP